MRSIRWSAFVGLSVLLLGSLPRPSLASSPPLGGVQQVQLDVVVARVRGGLARHAASLLLKRGGRTLTGGRGSPAFAGILFPDSGFLGFLQSMEKEKRAEILAMPRLVTLSGRPASFLDGGQVASTPAGLGQVGVQLEEFGTRLNFLPIVRGGKIDLEVEPEVSTLVPGDGTAGRQTQRIHLKTEMESGQTLVIGGLGQRTVRGEETELLILVTPALIDLPPGDRAEPRGEKRLRLVERKLKKIEKEVESLRRLLRPGD
jgi:Flp pilus assembly secretin CpaC